MKKKEQLATERGLTWIEKLEKNKFEIERCTNYDLG